MHTEKILAFSDFLARQPNSYNEIAQFLAMNTFRDEKFLCIFIGELVETGTVHPIAGFGFDSDELGLFADIPIQGKYPLTEAIRSNRTNLMQNDPAFEKEYPLMNVFKSSHNWKSGISIPVYPIGGMSMCSSKKLELTDAMEVFYIAIGSLLGLYSSRLPKDFVEQLVKIKDSNALSTIPLTERQKVIAGMLERGFNNAQIGIELGFSESLIRQETVAIYRKLDVSGRKAMQNSEPQ